jgi:hypothetical protein
MGISFAGRDSIGVGSNDFTSTVSATKFHSINSQLPYLVNQASGGTVTEVNNYNGSGQRWKVHAYSANGTFSLTNGQQPLRYLLVGGGSPGGSACNWAGNGGTGGNVLDATNQMLAPGNYAVVRGPAATPSTLGNVSSSAGISGGAGGGGGSCGNNVPPGTGSPGPLSDITGTSTRYAGGGGGGASNCAGAAGPGAGSIGVGGTGSPEGCWAPSSSGGAGGVFVAYQTAYVSRVGF